MKLRSSRGTWVYALFAKLADKLDDKFQSRPNRTRLLNLSIFLLMRYVTVLQSLNMIICFLSRLKTWTLINADEKFCSAKYLCVSYA